MWNLRSLKMSVMLVASGIAVVAALPAKAQQVVLTPNGTAFAMPPVVEPVVAPIETPRLTPSVAQVQSGKAMYYGTEVDILADNDPRIPENARLSDPRFVYVIGLMNEIPLVIPVDSIGKLVPPTMEEIMGLPPGSLQPGGEQTFYPGVIAPGTGIDAEYKPGPVEVTTVTGPILEIDPDALIGGPGGVKYSELAKGNKPDSSRTYTPEELAEAYRRGEIFYPLGSFGSSAANQKELMPGITLGSGTGTNVIDDGMYGARPVTGIVQILDENTSRILTPEEVALFNQRYIKPYNPNAVNPLSQSLPSIQPTVTVQASQNPSADFATTRSAPRNTVPEQLNRGVVDSPLSNSRIFPGMR
jgi:hypothetical protein